MNHNFKLIGRVLRILVYVPCVILWSIYIFPIIFIFALIFAVGHVVLHVVLFPIAYLIAAFEGQEKPPKWEDGWKDFPDKYIKWLSAGYIAMYRWMLSEMASDEDDIPTPQQSSDRAIDHGNPLKRRFQVFVSSTYTDLQEERRHAIQALLETKCIYLQHTQKGLQRLAELKALQSASSEREVS